jgi:RNA polymerase sigma-70 factor (ECF subfamily)
MGELAAAVKGDEAAFELEPIFAAHYERIARVIARVIQDPARAEELAVDVFLKLWRTPHAQGANAEGWLYRTAVRAGLNELRGQMRRSRYERLSGFLRRVPTPEQIRAATEEQERVRLVLSVIQPRQAELLLLRSQGLRYDELASALSLNAASVGTLLGRAQLAFRKEYSKRYGQA